MNPRIHQQREINFERQRTVNLKKQEDLRPQAKQFWKDVVTLLSFNTSNSYNEANEIGNH
jgi:hypothetical protein